MPVLVSLGLVLVLAGLAAPALFHRAAGLPDVCVALGVLLFPVAEHLHTSLSGKQPAGVVPVIQWTLTFVLASIGLFWAVNDYSAAVGEAGGYEYETKLRTMPETVVSSTRDLGIRAPDVTATPCTAPDSAYRFRYDGLVLVLQPGGPSFLLPKGWTRLDGVALALPRSGDVRLLTPRIASPYGTGDPAPPGDLRDR
ncbi:hypothetical protein AB0M48_32655 [Lentzea sp. NPDC051208]|uniref:hypothetical protein n=1 Tax=Lentzea sp. NPDC051208 TaxID=3154642 RepID=UPI00343460B0